MTEKKAKIICLVLAILILIFAFIEEIYIRPEYLIKCIIKISTFGGVILLYSALTKKKITDIINLKKPGIRARPTGTVTGRKDFLWTNVYRNNWIFHWK